MVIKILLKSAITLFSSHYIHFDRKNIVIPIVGVKLHHRYLRHQIKSSLKRCLTLQYKPENQKKHDNPTRRPSKPIYPVRVKPHDPFVDEASKVDGED